MASTRCQLAGTTPSACAAAGALHVTPACVLQLAKLAFASPEEEEDDDTPRSFFDSPERLLPEDDLQDEPESLSGAAWGCRPFTLSLAALASGTPAPGASFFSPPPPPAPAKGKSAYPSRAQGGSASASRCRERLAGAAAPLPARTFRRASHGGRPPPFTQFTQEAALFGSPPRRKQRGGPLLERASPSLERAAGVTGTRKRLDDALDDAVPACSLTPQAGKRLRGAEDLFASMRLE